MYIIVTYGRPGMKGVQTRGLRIAGCFPKKDVVIINDQEGEWMKNQGYRIIEIPLHEFLDPEVIRGKIIQEFHPKAIIFADRPTNLISQTTLLMEANKAHIPVIIFENYYAQRKLLEKVYANSLQLCDLLIYNGLSFAKGIETEKIKLIPPFTVKPSRQNLENWRQKLSLNSKETVIAIFAYNGSVFQEIHQLVKDLITRKLKFIIITDKKNLDIFKDCRNVILLPFLNLIDISSIINISDVIIGKMGYLQFLETLAHKKIFIGLGEEKGFRKYWLDHRLQDVCFYFKKCNESMIKFITDLINNQEKKRELINRISLLHDGSFFKPQTLKKLILSTKFTPKTFIKTILLYATNGENLTEINQIRKIIQREHFILPFIFYIGKRGKNELNKLFDYNLSKRGAMLHSSCGIVNYFTPYLPFSLPQIYPWHLEFLSFIKIMLSQADKVIIYGKSTKFYFNNLWKK